MGPVAFDTSATTLWVDPDQSPTEVNGGAVDRREPKALRQRDRGEVMVAPADQQLSSQAAPPAGLKPRDVVKAAKARASEIRAQLRVMKRLEKELVELERLIAAAKQKPVALVRNIDHARHAR